ncbi:FHA domain-containing protein [Myxococcus sp. CA051A]|uniref:FHA domain-containing protein n=1 Tax=Myxococcus llanfairpwllgwyngyllgogerychwyrndrobwllllantysiliogogogochensis TaxID=2590453 RepID=A0A540WJN6_9BACT|nr:MULTISPECIES: FHA domain-containing protein [Myxococcus]NTX03522.1 FHA domain-containing protein [Myxococcus sp. CA040A]NTX14316.1 FHA domain-containing protein [Myxococcus sp. CA056]NTX41292.1 FHA domain-containing protein [Myxococcus sp. CA033]NTX67141.1 FHA domain-containing protein [Myxococcus sp. CA051A]TQF09211.1 FHA domain-containing protein [Myxococcus llanfairpwllgwyngyllgogerychwyrndrobwllllantysiliogogogochensis]
MIDQNSRPARKVGIADHLWDTYEEMAQQMGSDRDALINQALFMFARLNGFIEARSRAEAHAAPSAAPAPARPAPISAAPAPRASSPPVLAPAPAPKAEPPPPPRPGGRSAAAEERASANGLDNDPVRREVAERVLETAAELERLIKGKNEPPPPNDDMVEEDEEPLPEDQDDPGLEDEQAEPEEEPADELAEEEDEGNALYLVTESGDQERIIKERFVIGRGKHCDFVINSGKVSREHAVIAQEGHDWIIEDLGSSNGTWFNKQRIKRRKVEDGDEYFICSEKIRLVLR